MEKVSVTDIQFHVLLEKKYMNFADKSFLSSTAWTERVGFVAANATIDFLQEKSLQTYKFNRTTN